MDYFLYLFASYLLGSAPFGLIVSKIKGINIREHGSKNIGATNVGRVLGFKYFLLVFILDCVKGFLPLHLAKFLIANNEPTLLIVIGFLTILGHIFPIWLRFKGGKGVATALGVIIGIDPLSALISFTLWIIIVLITRYISVGSIIAAFSLPIIYTYLNFHILKETLPIIIFFIMASVLVIFRHRSNIVRLKDGKESKFSFSKAKINI